MGIVSRRPGGDAAPATGSCRGAVRWLQEVAPVLPQVRRRLRGGLGDMIVSCPTAGVGYPEQGVRQGDLPAQLAAQVGCRRAQDSIGYALDRLGRSAEACAAYDVR